MSVITCHYCEKLIDLDVDVEHEENCADLANDDTYNCDYIRDISL